MGESDENKIVSTFFTLYSPFAIPAAARRAARGGIRRHERGRRFSPFPISLCGNNHTSSGGLFQPDCA